MRPCSVVHPMRVVVGKILCPALRADSKVRCAYENNMLNY
jgi:hypothetical protein